MKNTMEVLVLVDFEGTMADELVLSMGDVIKNVTKANDEGWLQGELKGKRGVFPGNFVKEVPVNLRGDKQREPRSIRTSTEQAQFRVFSHLCSSVELGSKAVKSCSAQLFPRVVVVNIFVP